MFAAMKRSGSAPCLAAIFLALLSAQAHALFDDDEARKRIADTNQRLNQIDSQLDARLTALEQQKSGEALLDLSAQLDAVRADVAKLYGQIEVLSYELSEAQKRQRDLYTDLDSRLRQLEGGGAGLAPEAAGADGAMGSAAPGLPPASPSVPRDEAAEQKAYDDAMARFKRGDYPGAANAFTAFVATYPQSPLASSAQYWIGNARFAQRDYKAAVAAQTTLLQKYPDSPKAPDAMLNLASAQAESGYRAAARKTLQDLVGRYPSSDAAAKARQRLR